MAGFASVGNGSWWCCHKRTSRTTGGNCFWGAAVDGQNEQRQGAAYSYIGRGAAEKTQFGATRSGAKQQQQQQQQKSGIDVTWEHWWLIKWIWHWLHWYWFDLVRWHWHWRSTQSQSALSCDEWAQILFSKLSRVVAIEAVSHPIDVGGIWGAPWFIGWGIATLGTMSDLFVQLLRHLTLTALDAAVAVEQAALTQWTHAVFFSFMHHQQWWASSGWMNAGHAFLPPGCSEAIDVSKVRIFATMNPGSLCWWKFQRNLSRNFRHHLLWSLYSDHNYYSNFNN